MHGSLLFLDQHEHWLGLAEAHKTVDVILIERALDGKDGTIELWLRAFFHGAFVHAKGRRRYSRQDPFSLASRRHSRRNQLVQIAVRCVFRLRIGESRRRRIRSHRRGRKVGKRGKRRLGILAHSHIVGGRIPLRTLGHSPHGVGSDDGRREAEGLVVARQIGLRMAPHPGCRRLRPLRERDKRREKKTD